MAGRSSALFPLLAILGVAACGSDSAGVTEPGEVASVMISPAQAVIVVGQTQQFVAAAFDSGGHVVTGTSVSWSVDKPNVITMNQEGRATGLSAGMATITATVEGHSNSAVVTVASVQPANGDINVDPAITYQTMLGWDAVPQMGHWECGTPSGPIYFATALFERYRDAALDSLASAGINRVRVPVRPSAEYSRDVWGEFESGQIDFNGYKKVWYDAQNDNADPNTINPAGFHFSELQYTVDKVVEPFRQKIAARGEKLYIVLNFIQFARVAAFQHRFDPPEYAEFMLAAFQFLENRYGWVPDAIEIINEPDNGNNKWTADQIGQVIAATGARLAAAGYRPDFVAPSTVYMTNAVTMYNGMINIPGVKQYLSELSYHRYGGITPQALQQIGAIAQQGLRTAMLEHLSSGYENLHADLKIGRVSSWEMYTLGGCGTENPKAGSVIYVDVSNQAAPVVHIQPKTYFVRLYYRYIRRNAVRIDATSSNGNLDPLAFVNEDGRFVVVVKAATGATFTVGGLPPGRYGVVYTTGPNEETPIQKNIELPDIDLPPGEALSTGIPDRGVITIHAK